jgi:hypothetical protein
MNCAFVLNEIYCSHRADIQPLELLHQSRGVPFMSHPSITPEERFATIVEELLSYPDVTPPSNGSQSKKRLGDSALRIHHKIFAMLVKGRLVVKLPKPRVDALITSGEGECFDPGHGRVMKEWVAVEPTAETDWLPLAREAMEFVASQR